MCLMQELGNAAELARIAEWQGRSYLTNQRLAYETPIRKCQNEERADCHCRHYQAKAKNLSRFNRGALKYENSGGRAGRIVHWRVSHYDHCQSTDERIQAYRLSRCHSHGNHKGEVPCDVGEHRANYGSTAAKSQKKQPRSIAQTANQSNQVAGELRCRAADD